MKIVQLKFDNKQQNIVNSDLVREEARLPAVSSAMLFDIFPFIIVFGEDMVIQVIIIKARNTMSLQKKLVFCHSILKYFLRRYDYFIFKLETQSNYHSFFPS